MPSQPKFKSRKPADEKITVNLAAVDLGQIDLLVQEGFYANRTEFIRAAVRNHIATHADVVRQVTSQRTLVMGMQHFDAAALQVIKAANKKLDIRVLGLASFAADVTPALALATIESIQVLGALHASPELKKALTKRIR